MSQETQSNQQAPAGQPGNASAGEQPTGQPKYPTFDETRALIKDELLKSSQATVDRVTNQVKKVIDAAASRGVTLTADQAQAVIDASTPQQPGQKTSAASTDTRPPAPAQAPAAPAADGQQISQGTQSNLDPVTRKAVSILKTEFNVIVDPDNLPEGDPDNELIDFDTDDPEKFFATIRTYGKTKQEKAALTGTPAVLPGLASGGKTSATSPFEGQGGRKILSDYYTKHT